MLGLVRINSPWLLQIGRRISKVCTVNPGKNWVNLLLGGCASSLMELHLLGSEGSRGTNGSDQPLAGTEDVRL